MQQRIIQSNLVSGLTVLLIGLMMAMGNAGVARPLERAGFSNPTHDLTTAETTNVYSASDVESAALVAAGSGNTCCSCDRSPNVLPVAQDVGYVRLARAIGPCLLAPLRSEPPNEPPRI